MQKLTKLLRHLSLALALAVIAPVSAAELSVVVIARDGSQQEVAISDLSRMEIGSTSVTLHSKDGAAREHSIADIERILIGAESTAISDLTADGSIAVWPKTVTDGRVNIAGATPGATVTVSDIAGHAVTATTDADGAATIDISALGTGVTIVSISPNHSVKIIKK